MASTFIQLSIHSYQDIKLLELTDEDERVVFEKPGGEIREMVTEMLASPNVPSGLPSPLPLLETGATELFIVQPWSEWAVADSC